jgi:hypothetical protein
VQKAVASWSNVSADENQMKRCQGTLPEQVVPVWHMHTPTFVGEVITSLQEQALFLASKNLR